ncbi:MAG: D-alanyl-D-alanine carboxypeptidase/D-alanyl-D-alanine endopeptidase [Gaiellaceae bacterium]
MTLLALGPGWSTGATPQAAISAAKTSDETAKPALQRALARALGSSRIPRRLTGALAVDLSSGEDVFALNGRRPLEPASTEKLAVSFSALRVLGPDFQIETLLLGRGSREGSTWKGDLVLQGHGDPTLSGSKLAALARRVRYQGIRTVSGDVLGDESAFDARRTVAGWKPSFYVNECPPLSALIVDGGRYHGHVGPAPALSAAQAFRDALRVAGVRVLGSAGLGGAGPDPTQLSVLRSPPLSRLLQVMDRDSDNFIAELVLKQLGATVADPGTSATGASVVRQQLGDAGVPLDGLRIVDGSGLSLLDRLTPAALVALLQAAWDDPSMHPTLLADLAVAGRNGTLADRMRQPPALGTVRAKTGTTGEASALAGFVGDRFAFAILQNGHPVSSERARRSQDRFAALLAAQ